MKTLLKSAIALSFVLASVNSVAGSDTGIYIGGSIGQSGFEVTEGDFNIDESDSAYKVFVGYNFGIVPVFDLAVEADYRNFGTFENDTSKSELTSIDLYGLAAFNFGPVGIFGKAGYTNTDVDQVVETENYSTSESGLSYGIGVKAGLGSIKFRAEYEMFDIEDTDTVYMASVGVAYTF